MPGPLLASDGPGRSLLTLAPQTAAAPLPTMDGEVLRFASPEPDASPRLARGQTDDFLVRNATTEAVSFDWRGLRGGFSLDDPGRQALRSIARDETRTLGVAPRDPGLSILRAVPSAAHLAERGASAVVVTEDRGPMPADVDVIVALGDWLLAADGSPRFGSVAPADATSRIITVNGRPAPTTVVEAPRTRLRLRVANLSPQRIMVLACEGGKPVVAAIDGQPCEPFAPVRTILPIGPGARYDLLVDMPEAGSTIRFVTKRIGAPGPTEPEGAVLVLQAKGEPRPARSPITPLPANPALPSEIPLETAKRVDLVLAGDPEAASSGPRHWTVNGVTGEQASRPVLGVRAGDVVTLGLINTSATVVPLRIGGQAVRLLHARDDGWDPYWRDTVLLPPQSRNHVAFVADVPGRWPIDSGFDDLTLAGLSCSFVVSPR